ncbi:MAG: alanyl-tRNA editing protein, partial [Candidatus Heimdallarchaeota archaeon]|nr:alanyl-tRNA editing protein [Candidatus Heimdallarchaeota archaeon]
WNKGQVKVTGNDISIGQGRIDFNFPDFQRDLIEKFVTKANEIIQQNLQVITYNISREELEKNPSLTKLAMGIPKHIETIRIVEIEGYDKQPDGGCHVSSLSEIGIVTIMKIKNKGKNNRRLYFELL